MDVFNPEAWKQQLAAFMSYPYIMLTGIAITAGIVWWFRGFQIKIFEDRLKLAADKVELADRAKNEVETQFRAYKDEIATGGGKDALIERVANVEAAIEKLSAANNAVRSAIGAARISSTSSMSVDVSLSNSTLPLRQAEADEERPK